MNAEGKSETIHLQEYQRVVRQTTRIGTNHPDDVPGLLAWATWANLDVVQPPTPVGPAEKPWPDPDLGAHARTLREIATAMDVPVRLLASAATLREGILDIADQLDALARPIIVTHPHDEEQHRCARCGHRWQGKTTVAELCGDCWRSVQPVGQEAAK